MLGAHLGDLNGGVTFGVPVQPCNKDKRGCKPLKNYMDLDKNQMAGPISMISRTGSVSSTWPAITT